MQHHAVLGIASQEIAVVLGANLALSHAAGTGEANLVGTGLLQLDVGEVQDHVRGEIARRIVHLV